MAAGNMGRPAWAASVLTTVGVALLVSNPALFQATTTHRPGPGFELAETPRDKHGDRGGNPRRVQSYRRYQLGEGAGAGRRAGRHGVVLLERPDGRGARAEEVRVPAVPGQRRGAGQGGAAAGGQQRAGRGCGYRAPRGGGVRGGWLLARGALHRQRQEDSRRAQHQVGGLPQRAGHDLCQQTSERGHGQEQRRAGQPQGRRNVSGRPALRCPTRPDRTRPSLTHVVNQDCNWEPPSWCPRRGKPCWISGRNISLITPRVSPFWRRVASTLDCSRVAVWVVTRTTAVCVTILAGEGGRVCTYRSPAQLGQRCRGWLVRSSQGVGRTIVVAEKKEGGGIG